MIAFFYFAYVVVNFLLSFLRRKNCRARMRPRKLSATRPELIRKKGAEKP